jgi:hypothetical protein
LQKASCLEWRLLANGANKCLYKSNTYAFLQDTWKARLQKDLQEEIHGAQVSEAPRDESEICREKYEKSHMNQGFTELHVRHGAKSLPQGERPGFPAHVSGLRTNLSEGLWDYCPSCLMKRAFVERKTESVLRKRFSSA